MKYKWVITIAFCCLAIIVFLYLIWSQKIEFKEVKWVMKHKDGTSLVYIVKSKDDAILEYHGIDLPEINWEESNLVITEGWPLKQILYVDFNPFIGADERLVKVELDKTSKSSRVYIYKIKKINIYLDERYPWWDF